MLPGDCFGPVTLLWCFDETVQDSFVTFDIHIDSGTRQIRCFQKLGLDLDRFQGILLVEASGFLDRTIGATD